MATILNFPAIHREPAKSGPETDGPNARQMGAQILFFTGVRYERFEKAQRRKVKLDPPELPLAL